MPLSPCPALATGFGGPRKACRPSPDSLISAVIMPTNCWIAAVKNIQLMVVDK